MTQLFKALLISIVLPLAACQATVSGSSVTEDHGHSATMDQPSTHGMLMVGDGPVYLSHLPMFHKPHDYQVLLQVSLMKEGADPTGIYSNDRQVTGERIYTVVPETFVLTELFTPMGQPTRTSFKATLYRGHFERGGTAIMNNVTVNVTRVVVAKRFAKEPVAALPNLKYYVFGDDTQLFAAHVINRKPDFDHVVSVRVVSGVLDAGQASDLSNGSIVDFTEVANDVDHALAEGATILAKTSLGGSATQIEMQVLSDYYLETGDLAL